VAAASETHYARAEDGAHLAYQVRGDGPRDILCVGYGTFISIDMRDEEPHFRAFEARLGSFGRFIRYDPRGIGLSDPASASLELALEVAAADAIAVLDAVGSERAALFAAGGSGLTSLTVAATYPERVSSLVLVNCYARLGRSADYPEGLSNELIDTFLAGVLAEEGEATEVDDAGLMAPTLAQDPTYRAWWKRAGQRGASPSSARALLPASLGGDVRSRLGKVGCPTLVVQRKKDRVLSPGHGRYLAEHIAGAQLVELPGADHLPYSGDAAAIVDEIEEFLTGARSGGDPERVIMTILFTDIVGSTEQAERLGDRSWRLLLDRHDEMLREQLRRFRGREIKTTGDGMLATFESPTSGMRCALAILASADQVGLEIRAGIHTGEVERRGDDVSGIAVHIAQRVSSMAGAGDVFVSRTVADLVTGSAFEFEDRGDHPLKGVAGTWRLFRLRS
jgi:class 3 adenylate cyclase